MNARTWSLVCLIIGSLCYLISFKAILKSDDAFGTKFYFQIAAGVIFFAMAWIGYFKNRSKRTDETK
ncbi:MAG TPA: hypothetical protein VMU30_01100 [Bacteroidota bacterium]|nr:hypothetical protein [Bacteroidota bacterium]